MRGKYHKNQRTAKYQNNELALLSLAVRPVAQPPFPLEGLYPEK
ncbi:MAG: hypothetical protein WC370_01750 [Dehalococcoidales bacterium]|jgi:hypothetical protein